MQVRTMLRSSAATLLAAALALYALAPAAVAEAVERAHAVAAGGGSAVVVAAEGFDPAAFAEAGLSWEGLLEAKGADVTAEEAEVQDGASDDAAASGRSVDDGLSARGASYEQDAGVGAVYLVTALAEGTADVVARASAIDGVLFAEADQAVSLDGAGTEGAAASADESFDATGFQWALGAQGGVADVAEPAGVNGAGELTGVSTDGERAIVALLDTGVDYTNPSLAGSFVDLSDYPGLMEATGCGRWGANATVSEDSADFADPMDCSFHGTHVAGIIAGDGAVSGMAPDAQLVGVRVFDDGSAAYMSSVIRGIGWLVEAKADFGLDVVGFNLSMGGTIGTANAMRAAMLVAEEHDIVAMVASGNSNVDMDSDAESMLSACRVDSTIAVDSHDMAGKKSSFSNYGAESTDVFAPGSYIMSSLPTSQSRFLPYAAAASGDALVYEGFEAEGAVSDASVNGGLSFSLDASSGNASAAEASAEPDGSRFYLGEASLSVPLTERWEEIPFPELPEEVEYKLGGTIVSEPVDLMAQERWREPAEDDPALFGLSFAIPQVSPDAVEVSVSFRMEDGSFSEPVTRTETWDYGMWGEWASSDQNASEGAARIPDGVDYDAFQVKVSIMMQWHDEASVPAQLAVNIDTVGVGYGAHSYGMLNGTSMAAPMVTGSLAALAAAHPEESSQRVAARILGGAQQTEELTGLCETDGRLDLAAANGSESTLRPVVTDAEANGGLLTLCGWFLGDGAGAQVSVGGVQAEVVSWKPDTATERGTVVVRVPEGASGEQEVTLARADGHSWTVDATVEDPVTDFTELSQPDDEAYSLAEAAGLVAYEGDVWLSTLGVPEREDVPVLFRYRVQDGAWDAGIEGESVGLHLGTTTSDLVATDEGLYRILGGTNPFDVQRYDEATGTFSSIELNGHPNLYEYAAVTSWGSSIVVVGSQQNAAGQYSTVSVVDPAAGTVRQVAGIGATTALRSASSAVAAGDELFVLLRTGVGTDWTYRLFVVDLTKDDTVREVSLPAYDTTAPSIPSLAAVEALDGDRVVITGLPATVDGAYRDVWLLDPATDEATPSSAVLQYGGTNMVEAAVEDGALYVWGVARQTPGRTFFRSIALEDLGLRMTEDEPDAPEGPDDPGGQDDPNDPGGSEGSDDPEKQPVGDPGTTGSAGSGSPTANAGRTPGQQGGAKAPTNSSASAGGTNAGATAKLAATGDDAAAPLAAFATLAVAAGVTIVIVRGARRDEARDR